MPGSGGGCPPKSWELKVHIGIIYCLFSAQRMQWITMQKTQIGCLSICVFFAVIFCVRANIFTESAAEKCAVECAIK